MSVAEITCRLYRFFVQTIESRLLALGWRPELRDGSGDGRSIFVTDTNLASEWRRQFNFDRRYLDELVNGRIELFSYGNISLDKDINWLREPVSGVFSPTGYGKGINYRNRKDVGDIKNLWELGRQQYLVPLAVGYLLTGETQYRDTIKEHIESWIMSCPFGYTIHWCSSLEVALRVISWSIIHSLLLVAGEKNGLYGLINPETLRNTIFQHAYFIRHYLSLHSSANNHLIGELVGLWTVTSIFDLGRKGDKWSKYAANMLEAEAQKQVYSDGVNKEQAVYYHYWVLEYLVFSYLIGLSVKHGFSVQYQHRIQSMAQFLSAISPVEGNPPQIGDADDGFVSRFSIIGKDEPFDDIHSICHLLMNETSSASATEKSFWYSHIAGICVKKRAASIVASNSNYPQIFHDGGYAVLGSKIMHIVFDAGPLGYTSIAAHGHADALSICVAIDNMWWLVDPGTYTYHDNPEWRNYFRSTAAHNTVLVDGKNQSKIGGDFLWLEHAAAQITEYGANEDRQWVRGEHDGYKCIGITHHRRIDYSQNDKKLLVSDVFEGAGEHELIWHWHLHPNVTVKWDGALEGWILEHCESSKKLLLRGGEKHSWNIMKGVTGDTIMGWYSDSLGKKVPATVLQYRMHKTLPFEMMSSFTLLG